MSTPAPPRARVIVVAYQSGDYLAPWLDALAAQTFAADEAVVAAAVEIAELSPDEKEANKRILSRLRAVGRSLPAEVESELEGLHQACFTPEQLGEGIAAFSERRAPRWPD